ncbi:MAG: SDR family oxidoreductase [Acidobacteriia bacterium]|nr:SDR family oxidoreductase [Terriglobia bacterium]
MEPRQVFLSGGTGYVGRALVSKLVERGHHVRVLARAGSEHKVPNRAEVVPGNPLDAATFSSAVSAADTFVQLTGVAHPAPWKEEAFRAIDLVSLSASAAVAKSAGVSHFVYVSVAQPAPVMKAYIRVRQECEAILKTTDLTTTILRPWYVLGPGHRWPAALAPVYSLLEAIPATREGALRLGLVTLDQMVKALLWAVENPPNQPRILDVPAIRAISA